MLHKLHLQAYQALERTLLELQSLACNPNLEPAALQKNFHQVQQVFQQQILPLTGEELYGSASHRWQSVQTEIHRSLRLLEMDILFLRSSKQAATTEARLKSLRDRTEQIIGYCQVMLQEG